MNPTVGDYPLNAGKILRCISEAEKKRLDWVVFSELSLCGYPVWDLANKPKFVETGLSYLQKIAAATRGKKVQAIVGFVDKGPEGSSKSYNALAVLAGGKIVHKQYKTLLPTY